MHCILETQFLTLHAANNRTQFKAVECETMLTGSSWPKADVSSTE